MNKRDSYAKYLRSIKTITGQSTKRYKNWQWAKHMKAFKPFLAFANTASNVSCDQIHELGNDDNSAYNPDTEIQYEYVLLDNQPHEDGIQNSETNAKYATHLQEKRKHNTLSSNAPSSLHKVPEYFQNKRGRYDDDATELILLGYAKTIKTFSLKIEAKTKFQIAEIIMRQEIVSTML